MGHFSFEIRDSRSLSGINAALKARDVICQLPPYSFRFPQEQYTTGSNMCVHLKFMYEVIESYILSLILIHPKRSKVKTQKYLFFPGFKLWGGARAIL